MHTYVPSWADEMGRIIQRGIERSTACAAMRRTCWTIGRRPLLIGAGDATRLTHWNMGRRPPLKCFLPSVEAVIFAASPPCALYLQLTVLGGACLIIRSLVRTLDGGAFVGKGRRCFPLFVARKLGVQPLTALPLQRRLRRGWYSSGGCPWPQWKKGGVTGSEPPTSRQPSFLSLLTPRRRPCTTTTPRVRC